MNIIIKIIILKLSSNKGYCNVSRRLVAVHTLGSQIRKHFPTHRRPAIYLFIAVDGYGVTYDFPCLGSSEREIARVIMNKCFINCSKCLSCYYTCSVKKGKITSFPNWNGSQTWHLCVKKRRNTWTGAQCKCHKHPFIPISSVRSKAYPHHSALNTQLCRHRFSGHAMSRAVLVPDLIPGSDTKNIIVEFRCEVNYMHNDVSVISCCDYPVTV